MGKEAKQSEIWAVHGCTHRWPQKTGEILFMAWQKTMFHIGTWYVFEFISITTYLNSKLAYIKLAWGSPVEQAVSIAAGNLNAKDWQDKVKQIVERTVSCLIASILWWFTNELSTDSTILQKSALSSSLLSHTDNSTCWPCQNLTNTTKCCSLIICKRAGHLNFGNILGTWNGMWQKTQILLNGSR